MDGAKLKTCLKACLVSDDESELSNKFCLTAFEDFYSVKKLVTQTETSHLRDLHEVSMEATYC